MKYDLEIEHVVDVAPDESGGGSDLVYDVYFYRFKFPSGVWEARRYVNDLCRTSIRSPEMRQQIPYDAPELDAIVAYFAERRITAMDFLLDYYRPIDLTSFKACTKK